MYDTGVIRISFVCNVRIKSRWLYEFCRLVSTIKWP